MMELVICKDGNMFCQITMALLSGWQQCGQIKIGIYYLDILSCFLTTYQSQDPFVPTNIRGMFQDTEEI
ncbi:hypothetical protein Y981_04635 [Leptospirillum ferriphilum YSK]|uniref:Uncharacterized protein n=1 Tax=Leptospirillum ferriphilum YSK TaxID=1441628 RepID=A0A059XWX0_9BACT|nr:hypothetical protein Y981_04635 [Leptospirillum ferriphilum YSK]